MKKVPVVEIINQSSFNIETICIITGKTFSPPPRFDNEDDLVPDTIRINLLRDITSRENKNLYSSNQLFMKEYKINNRVMILYEVGKIVIIKDAGDKFLQNQYPFLKEGFVRNKVDFLYELHKLGEGQISLVRFLFRTMDFLGINCDEAKKVRSSYLMGKEHSLNIKTLSIAYKDVLYKQYANSLDSLTGKTRLFLTYNQDEEEVENYEISDFLLNNRFIMVNYSNENGLIISGLDYPQSYYEKILGEEIGIEGNVNFDQHPNAGLFNLIRYNAIIIQDLKGVIIDKIEMDVFDKRLNETIIDSFKVIGTSLLTMHPKVSKFVPFIKLANTLRKQFKVVLDTAKEAGRA